MAVTVILPCKVGETVWMICKGEVVSGIIDRFIIGDAGIPMADICLSDNEWAIACEPHEYYLSEAAAQETWKHSADPLKPKRKKRG